MRVICTGSREFKDGWAIKNKLSLLPGGSTVVVGFNPETEKPEGADKIVYNYCKRNGIKVETYPAEWELHGKAAGFVRNTLMAELGADLCLAFWDGKSRGTMHMIQQAVDYGIRVQVVHARL